eukprot:524141_1
MAQEKYCDACKEPIRTKWYNVENLKLHPECFKCCECNEAINRRDKYYKKDDNSFSCANCTQHKSSTFMSVPWKSKSTKKSKPKASSQDTKPKAKSKQKAVSNKHQSSSESSSNPKSETQSRARSQSNAKKVGHAMDSFGKKLMNKSKKFAMEKVMKMDVSEETKEMRIALNELQNIKQMTHSLSDGCIANLYSAQEHISLHSLSLSEALSTITPYNLEEHAQKRRDRLDTKQEEELSAVLSEDQVFTLQNNNDRLAAFCSNTMAKQLIHLNKITNPYLVKMEQQLINPINIYKTKELKHAMLLLDEYESIKRDYDFAVHKHNKLINPNQKQKPKQHKIDEAQHKKVEKYELLKEYRAKMVQCIADLRSKQEIHLLQCVESFWKSYDVFVKQQSQVIVMNDTVTRNDCEKEEKEKESLTDKALRYKKPIKLDSGAFATVYRATDSANNDEVVAIKKICIGEGDNVLYLNSTKAEADNELNIMKTLKEHANITRLIDGFYEETVYNDLYLNLVMEFVPNTLRTQSGYYGELGQTIPHDLIKIYAFQLIKALNYMHIMKIAHRDIKPDNVLIDIRTHHLKLCDFGCSIKMETPYHDVDDADDDDDDGLQAETEGNYESYVCSRYYRAPELIFGSAYYDCKVDIWSIGCVLCEMFLGTVLFDGNDEEEVLNKMIDTLGTPTEAEIDQMKPYYPDKDNILRQYQQGQSWDIVFCAVTDMPQDAIDLIQNILVYAPNTRWSALKCLKSQYFNRFQFEKHDNETFEKLQLFDWTDKEIKYAKRNGIVL